MTNLFKDTAPQSVWRYFDKIRQIPHGSGNEKALGDALLCWAKDNGCAGKKDATGNVVISVPASPGAEKAPTLVLQSHMDMVCEKDDDHEFDFEKDSIVIKRDGDWVTADRTTLGADNGIGLAVSMAVMEAKDLVHGPLEILATVEEETGLTGASALDPSFVTGRILFNLDSEEDGVFCVGCAGGMDTLTELPANREPADNAMLAFSLKVAGLRGGHSGMDILDNRANALVLAARTLQALTGESLVRLSCFSGGDKHNAVPREASALVLVSPDQKERFFEVLTEKEAELKSEFGDSEPGLRVEASPADMPHSVFCGRTTDAIVSATLAFPNGVLSMTRGMKDLVETSNNPAKIRCEENKVTFLNSSRSSVPAALLGALSKIRAVATLSGARYEELGGYPGWTPNFQSPLLERARRIWRDVHGADPKIEVVHAGLECGIIGEKLPGMQMISLGPEIQNPHSPAERVSISSVERFYTFVKAFVQDIAAVR